MGLLRKGVEREKTVGNTSFCHMFLKIQCITHQFVKMDKKIFLGLYLVKIMLSNDTEALSQN